MLLLRKYVSKIRESRIFAEEQDYVIYTESAQDGTKMRDVMQVLCAEAK